MQEGNNVILAYPRFPVPDDIGRDLVRRLRQQVLFTAEQEAEDHAASCSPGPLRDEQVSIALFIRELRETETGAGA